MLETRPQPIYQEPLLINKNPYSHHKASVESLNQPVERSDLMSADALQAVRELHNRQAMTEVPVKDMDITALGNLGQRIDHLRTLRPVYTYDKAA